MLYIKRHIYILTALLVVAIIYSLNFNERFYGFEYEDAFISSSIASGENYFEKIVNFRTAEYSNFVNGKWSILSTYTGHYFPYSLYLFVTNKIFSCPSHLTHKIGNLILLLLGTGIIFLNKTKNQFLKLIFYCALISSLPYLYIINSSLIENLSFFVGMVFVVFLRYRSKTDFEKRILILLLIFLSIIKRENLFYLTLCPLFLRFSDFYNYKTILLFLLFITVQIVINPFFTEGLESQSIKNPTFSLNYIAFQLPTYLYSLIVVKGFLLNTMCLLLIKYNKKSIYLLVLWLGFIILYSFHYRSRYAVASEEIEIFDTYRYLVNTIPILFAVLIFSEFLTFGKFKILAIGVIPILSLFFMCNSLKTFNFFIQDEYQNFHKINDQLIQISKKSKIRVYDNFVLISILNFKKTSIDIYELHEFDEIIKSKNTFIINRFGDFPIGTEVELLELKGLSTNKIKVYSFK
jgi:hypothetical protein